MLSSSSDGWDCLKDNLLKGGTVAEGSKFRLLCAPLGGRVHLTSLVLHMSKWLWEMQRNKGERLFLIHCSQRQGKGPCVEALLCCSHRYNFRWEFSPLFITKCEGLIESVLISTELIASRTKMFWSCFLAFYIILLFLSLLSFLFLHALISVIPVYPVAYMLSFSVSFLWSLSFLSYNFWCSYSRLTLTFRASDT